MKKLGFTLAEVLITLAIVGIIAAVTIPALSRNVSQKSIGPTLAKGVNNLNAANSEALSKSGKTTLDKVADGSYLDLLELYLNGVKDEDAGVFYTHDGIAYVAESDQLETAKGVFNTNNSYKRGNATIHCTDNTANRLEPSCYTWGLADKYGKEYWKFLIDINGKKEPNQGGQDRFLVYVDTNGIVIPAGSVEASKYNESEEKDCLNLREASGDNAAQEIDEYCTATIIQNGWEMKF